jgi:toxin ParE1/3/4
MADLDLSPAARADLLDIRVYSVDQFGLEVANGYFLGFDAVFALLREHPLAGVARSDLGAGIRCLIHRRHRIFYYVDDDTVVIVRIVHHAMDALRAMKGRGG